MGGCIRGSWILEFRFFRVSDLRSLIFFELNFRSLIFMRVIVKNVMCNVDVRIFHTKLRISHCSGGS